MCDTPGVDVRAKIGVFSIDGSGLESCDKQRGGQQLGSSRQVPGKSIMSSWLVSQARLGHQVFNL